MPFYYEVGRATTTSASPNTAVTHLYATTIANQETVKIKAVYPSARGSSAGGAQIQGYANTGAVATGGGAQVPGVRGSPRTPAAHSVWTNDGSVITPGGTLGNPKILVGFAQTGGGGGWMALENDDSIEMLANGTNPTDVEFASVAAGTSVAIGLVVEFSEGG